MNTFVSEIQIMCFEERATVQKSVQRVPVAFEIVAKLNREGLG